MLNRLLSIITNVIFLVPIATWRFRRAHPGIPILAAGAVKAIETYTSTLERGPHWITAVRSTLIVTPEGLYAGKWQIPVGSIQRATLGQLRGGYVLVINQADGPIYQFGLTPDPLWETRLPFPVTLEKAKVRYSAFSIILRVFVFGMFFLTLWMALSK